MGAPAAKSSDAKRPRRIGKYEVFDAFATGGMASIHVGRLSGPAGFSKLVVVKQIHPKLARSEVHAKMLLEEARLAARIRSPYVVDIHEAIREDEQLCVVMELVRGVSLDVLLEKLVAHHDRVAPSIASAIVADALRGLHAAHVATDAMGRPLNIIHRDVSPHNLIVGSDGVTRVLDFGIAKGRDSEELTHTGEVKGKVGYMPAEQLTSKVFTRQVDVYAAGVVLWEALVGARLRNDGASSVLAEILQNAIKAPHEVVPNVPAALSDVVMTAVDREPARRYATAEAMAMALEEACPPASRDEVGRFVERVGFESLERFDEIMRACEAHVAPPPSNPRPVTAPAALATHGTSLLASTDAVPVESFSPSVAPPALREPMSRRHKVRSAAVVVGLALLLGVVALRVSRSRDDGRIPEARATEAPSAHEPTAPPVTASASPMSLPSAAPSASPPPSPEPLPSNSATRGASPSRPRSDKARLSCTPPFEYDAKGRKHYKRECLP